MSTDRRDKVKKIVKIVYIENEEMYTIKAKPQDILKITNQLRKVGNKYYVKGVR